MDEVNPFLIALSGVALYAVIRRFLTMYENGLNVREQLTTLGEECYRREGAEGVKLIK